MLHSKKAFTLIELSIVLVIIGLIVGGILVGQNLIEAAAVRAQISQIEKYQTAVNTFRGKYGYLPGDIPNPYAPQFGFQTRGLYAGEGDGNGVIQSTNSDSSAGTIFGGGVFSGEQGTFWVDLSTAKLVDGSFTAVTPTTLAVTATGTAISRYLPATKIGSGYVYAWSGGPAGHDGSNYFGIEQVTGDAGGSIAVNGTPLLTPSQAYAIDRKMDDGLPQSGSVIATEKLNAFGSWAAGGSVAQTPPVEYNYGDYNSTNSAWPVTSVSDIGDGTLEGPNSCFDARSTSAGSGTLPEQYSIEVAGGANVNCSLGFRFQ